MFEDGSFGIAITQINEQLISFGTSNNTLSRDIKRLLGKEFRTSSVKTKLYNQLINAVSLEQLEYLIIELTAKGNEQGTSYLKSVKIRKNK